MLAHRVQAAAQQDLAVPDEIYLIKKRAILIFDIALCKII